MDFKSIMPALWRQYHVQCTGSKNWLFISLCYARNSTQREK